VPEPIVVTETAAPAATRPAPAVPQVDISVALKESGLVMVETRRDLAPRAIPAEPEIRLGRKPKPVVMVSNEPMMQVETRK
jgi:hypothetical protein